MRHIIKNEELTVYLEGSIDTTNAEEVGSKIDELLKMPHKQLILDAVELKYISSAGLRQILRLKKKEKELKITNVSSEVYEVFDMTGFTEMIDIEKAYRTINVEGCEKLGEGSNGIVYRIDPETIIKVYKNPDALDDIKRERQLAKTALVMGINTAIPFDVVKVGERYGAVYELLNAKSLTKLIKANPDKKDDYIKIFVDMLKEIHNTPVTNEEIPDQKTVALGWVEWLKPHIEEGYYKKLKKLVEEIKDTGTLLHGDYHTNNVHFANNEAILIDMDTLSKGSPIFEFASIYLAYRGYGEVDHKDVESFLNLDWEESNYILDKTLDMYFENSKKAEEVREKARVLGYTRMLRRTIKRTPENVKLIEHSKNSLYELLDKVKDLNI